MKIAIYGAGAWGTALALAFSQRHAVTLLARDPRAVQAMVDSRQNERYLPGFPLPDNIALAADLSAVTQSDLAVVATPLSGFRAAVRGLAARAPAVPFIWVCKGLEAGTGLLPHQVVETDHPGPDSGVLTGPSFAEEVARGLPTAVTMASANGSFARALARELAGERLRIYANDDLIGAEVGGAVKNVLAIAVGVCDGLGLGLNARAALITRGMAEITRFGVALGAQERTFLGLAGLGDAILTCTGDLSRNRRLGLALAAGKSLGEIQRELGHVAEGALSAPEIIRRARALAIEMPIAEAVGAVLSGSLAPKEAVAALMGRDQREE